MTNPNSHFGGCSLQIQLAACVKAAHDVAHSLRAVHPDQQAQIEAGIASLRQFEAIMLAQLKGKTDFPPALLPLQRAMNDVLTAAGDELTRTVVPADDGMDVVNATLERLDQGQAAITQASIAGFMMLTHLARAERLAKAEHK